MTTNAGFLLMVGLGALLFLGKRPTDNDDASDKDLVTLTSGVSGTAVAADNSSVIIETQEPKDVVDIGGAGILEMTRTELEVRRSEQIKAQELDWAAGAIPRKTSGPVSPSQGDIDALKMAEGVFSYGGAARPTATAIPIWNNTYGWYWANPTTGRPVGPGGKEWSAQDTSVNMGSADTNIGQEPPPGWTATGGGSAVYTGSDLGLGDLKYRERIV